MKIRNVLKITALLGVCSTSAGAATVSFASAPAIQGPNLVYTFGDVVLTLTGYSYSRSASPTVGSSTATLGDQGDVHVDNQGLGVCDALSPDANNLVSCGQPLVDARPGNGGPEIVLFSFNKAVTLGTISFNQNNNDEIVDFYSGSTNTYQGTQTFTGGGPTDDTFTFVQPAFTSLTQFAVGAFRQGSNDAKSDQYRIAGFTFTCVADDCDDGTTGGPDPIPLPAGLPLLATALASGWFLRRRKS